MLKSKKKSNWWNTDRSKTHYTSVLFVTTTHGGVFVKVLQKHEEECMVGKGGLKVKDVLG